jgi:hypothetical protein
MTRVKHGLAALLIAATLGTACGTADSQPSADDNPAVDPECVPGSVTGYPIAQPDRRIEDIIEYLTGERQVGDEGRVEEKITDPNFGGVWGDFKAGVVVAVLDCSLVDADELARMAGGVGYLHLIEVPYTWREVQGFRDRLGRELNKLGIESDVNIESTLQGRIIEVHVTDADLLPGSFAPDVPSDAYVVVESPVVGTVPAAEEPGR